MVEHVLLGSLPGSLDEDAIVGPHAAVHHPDVVGDLKGNGSASCEIVGSSIEFDQ